MDESLAPKVICISSCRPRPLSGSRRSLAKNSPPDYFLNALTQRDKIDPKAPLSAQSTDLQLT